MNPDHLCFSCKHNKSTDGEDFACAKNMIANWNIGFYKNVFSCDEYDQEMECEVCGSPFVDKHRLWPGRYQGEYDNKNIAYLCPNHHRMIHHFMSVSKRITKKQEIIEEDATKWFYLLKDKPFVNFILNRAKPILDKMPDELDFDFGSDEANGLARIALSELYGMVMK